MALNSRSNFLPRHRTDRDTGRGALQAIAAATGALVLLTSGCSTAPSRPTPRNGGTIYVALANDPPSLNPLADDDADSVRAYTPIFPLLYAMNADLSVVPDLASGLPALSDDGTMLTVPLRDNAKWSDGMPITAADVTYTITTEMNAHLDTRAHFQWGAVKAVKAADDHTVQFTLSQADASFLADHLVIPIVPEHVYSKVDPTHMSTAMESAQPPVSGGPYSFDKRSAGTVTLDANRMYFGGKPHADHVVDTVVHDPGSVANVLAEGKLSFAPNLDAVTAGSAVITSGVTVLSYPDPSFVAAQFNVSGHHVFADHSVRMALALALDHDAIVSQASGTAQAFPQWGDVSSVSWAYSDSAAMKYKRDLSRAKQTLQSSGWTVGASGVATKAGQPLTASLIFPSSDATRTTAARLIAEQAAGAGFDLKTAGVSDADFAGALHSGAFDVALISVAAGPDPDRSSLLHTKGSANAGGYSNPDLDTLLESELSAVPSKSASLADVRKPIFGNIEKLVTTDLPIYVLWAPRRYAGFSLTLGGVTAVGAQLDADRDNSFYVSWFVTG